MQRLSALALCVGLLAVGCSKPGTTVVTSDGSKVTSDGATTTIETTNEKGEKVKAEMTSKEGDMTIKDANGNTSHVGTSASDADLGVDIYPGAKKDEAGGYTMENDKEKTMSFTYLTTDPVDNVIKFYKEKYPKANVQEMTNNGEKVAFMNSDEEKKKIIITVSNKKEEKDTKIGIMVNLKK